MFPLLNPSNLLFSIGFSASKILQNLVVPFILPLRSDILTINSESHLFFTALLSRISSKYFTSHLFTQIISPLIVSIQNRINIIISYFQLSAFIILNLTKGWIDYINFVIWT